MIELFFGILLMLATLSKSRLVWQNTMSHKNRIVFHFSLQTKRTYLRVYVVWESINLCYYAKHKFINEFSLTMGYLSHVGYVYEYGYLLSCVHSYYLNLFWQNYSQKCTNKKAKIPHEKVELYFWFLLVLLSQILSTRSIIIEHLVGADAFWNFSRSWALKNFAPCRGLDEQNKVKITFIWVCQGHIEHIVCPQKIKTNCRRRWHKFIWQRF